MTKFEELEKYLKINDHEEGEIFAVLDGAQFEDLPNDLFLGDFVYRPLYHDTAIGSNEQALTSPQFVWLDETGKSETPRSIEEVVDKLLELIDKKPAAVFWHCKEGGDYLYRHLRSINKVMMPIKPDHGSDTAEEKNKETHELVVFRHADSNVLAQVLPCLSPVEISRFLGPSDLVVLVADKQWANQETLLRAPRLENLPDAPTGPLHISTRTEERIKERREKVILARISAFLQKCAPAYTNAMEEAKLTAEIKRWRNEAIKLGTQTEAGVKKWAYLQLLSGGKLNNSVDVLKIFKHPDQSTSIDQRVDLLLRQSVPAHSGAV